MLTEGVWLVWLVALSIPRSLEASKPRSLEAGETYVKGGFDLRSNPTSNFDFVDSVELSRPRPPVGFILILRPTLRIDWRGFRWVANTPSIIVQRYDRVSAPSHDGTRKISARLSVSHLNGNCNLQSETVDAAMAGQATRITSERASYMLRKLAS